MGTDLKQTIINSVKKTVQEYDMFKGIERAIIAFSSGPDSVCLLDTLYNLYHNKIEFILVYVNHGLRKQEYLKKEEFLTEKYALKYNIKHKIIKLKLHKTKLGKEATARKMRYKALIKHMKQINGQAIVLGHNLDDVIETFFMNLIRGSGARGLRSIPAKREPFIRPLLNLKKAEIIKYLKHKRLNYSQDETNQLLDYRRNLLRQKTIPQVLEINPDLHKVIKRTINILKQDDEYIEKQADKAFQMLSVRKFNQVSLDINKLLKYNPAIQSRVVMKALKGLRGALDGFESKHIAQILSLKNKESGKKISLPKKLYAQKEYSKLVIGFYKPLRRINIAVNADNDFLVIGNSVVKVRTVTKYDLKNLKSNCEVFDFAELKLPLLIRNREDGDFIETKIGRKKVKKIFQERKLPIQRRKEIMMLCDQKGILWVIGVVRSSRALILEGTKKMVVVDFAHSN